MHFHPSQLYLLFPLLASAPKVHWQAEAGAPASEQEPKLLLGACSHNHIVLFSCVVGLCAVNHGGQQAEKPLLRARGM
jgi:hypothetical protein